MSSVNEPPYGGKWKEKLSLAPINSSHELRFMEGKSKVREVNDFAQSLRAVKGWRWSYPPHLSDSRAHA